VTDKFGREIDYLRVSVTDRCNLRCRYCMPEHGVDLRGHSEILRTEEILEICAAAVEMGVRKIRITGGEPLVRRGIIELCTEIAKLGVELAITTNGILLEQFAEPLKSAGVQRVNVSLDTLNPERFRTLTRGGELESVLRGIEAAKRAGLAPVKINCVLMRGVNDDEIDSFMALPDVQVRFIELMPIGESKARWSEQYYTLDPAKYTVIAPISHQFCSSCNRLRLTADGKLKPCLHSDEEYSIRGLHGDALKTTIQNAADAKPAAHDGLLTGSSSRREMNQIGG